MSEVLIGPREYTYRGMKMSHMVGYPLEALHAAAAAVGIDKRHFQDLPRKPHYDISKGKKQLLIDAGLAQVVASERDIILFIRHHYR